jgi:carbonic anhydrase
MKSARRRLLLGLLEFHEQSRPLYLERFRELGNAQAPETLFIACADSRVVPNLLASTDPGELFTMRNVGNLIPPAHDDGTSSGDLSEASAIEYAVSVLRVKNVVVCGHSNCGAMRAVWAGSSLDDAPNLARWLDHARPALARLRPPPEGDGSGGAAERPPQRPEHDRLSQENVVLQLEHLATYPAVRRALGAGTLSLVGLWFDIATGEVHVHNDVNWRAPGEKSAGFERLNRSSLERLAGDPAGT